MALHAFAGVNVIAMKRRKGEQEKETLTPGQSEAAPRVRVPALGHGQSDGAGDKQRGKE